MEKKTTTKDFYAGLIDLVMAATIEDEQKDAYIEFLEKKIEQLEAKQVKDRERAQKKKAVPDKLYDIVGGILTTDPQTAKEILAQVPAEVIEEYEVTEGKILARCRKMVASGKAEKDSIKGEKGTLVAYKLIAE